MEVDAKIILPSLVSSKSSPALYALLFDSRIIRQKFCTRNKWGAFFSLSSVTEPVRKRTETLALRRLQMTRILSLRKKAAETKSKC